MTTETLWVYKSQKTSRYKSKQKENSINTFKETQAVLVLPHQDETTEVVWLGFAWN
jgi:hypothetical protein